MYPWGAIGRGMERESVKDRRTKHLDGPGSIPAWVHYKHDIRSTDSEVQSFIKH